MYGKSSSQALTPIQCYRKEKKKTEYFMLNFKIYGYFRIKCCLFIHLLLGSFQSNIDLNGVTELLHIHKA